MIAAVAGLVPVRAQVSPGPLAHAHEDLDQNAKCFRCHGGGSDSIDGNCLSCHEEIAWLIEAGRGLHGRERLSECTSCHPDHGGRDFALIDWGKAGVEGFDHLRTGWQLEGKHRTLKCEQCHKSDFQKSPVVAKLKRKDANRSWLGLETGCLACHADYHAGALEANCEACHTNLAFKPAPRFDHARSSFPLTGKHVTTPCEKCHFVADRIFALGPEGRRVPRYKPVSHAECSDCHRDVHEGRLGPKCASCHVTTSFREVGRDRFDHARTRFALRGAHARVDCAKCHDPRQAWGKRPPFQRCDSCHRDAHAGTATLRGAAVDCAACHDERAFKPSTYRVDDHATSRYPLEGKHREVACERCHVKNPPGADPRSLGTAAVLLRPAQAVCRDCHEDSHGGQLAQSEHRGACESCHRVEGWKPSTYGIAEHGKTRLALEGRHAEIGCADCHGPTRPELPPLTEQQAPGKARVALTTLAPECVSCHYDPHRGRFAAGGSRPREDGCAGCHRPSAFRPATVDTAAHDSFAFRLEGGHRAVPCVDCHKELARPPATARLLVVTGSERPLLFEERHERCTDCHRSPHGDQFRDRSGGDRCDTCHDVERFRPATRFDHERDSAFPLRGGHQKVPCERCHLASVDTEGRKQVLYRPLKSECRDCHGPSIPKLEPDAGRD